MGELNFHAQLASPFKVRSPYVGRENRNRECMGLGMWGMLVPAAMLRLPFLLPTVEWR